MARVTHRDFSGGLWHAGPRDVVPGNFVRKAKGVRPWGLTGRAIRSRWGHQQIATCPATIFDILKFAGNRFVHCGTDFGRLVGSSYSSSLAGKVLATGCALRTATMVPSLDADVTQFPSGPDHMFVAGSKVDSGGNEAGSRTPFKISTSGALSDWGLFAPKGSGPAFLQAGVDQPFNLIIANFESSSPTLIFDQALAGNMAFLASAVNKQVGSGSYGFSVNQDTQGAASFLSSVNLLNYTPSGGTGAESAGEDFIRFWVFCTNPKNLDALEIIFDVTDSATSALPSNIGDPSGLNDTFSFKVLVEDEVTDTDAVTGTSDDARLEEKRHPLRAKRKRDQAQVDKIRGISNSGASTETTTMGEALSLSNAAAVQILKDLSTTKLSGKANTWTLLRIPKKLFTTSGKAVQGRAQATGDRTWAHVRRVRISATANDGGSVGFLFDQMALHLGTGMFGKYKYAVTYKNSKTGSRSNPSAIVETPTTVERQSVLLSGTQLLKQNMPEQADRIEVWRTLGNGDALYKIDEFDPVTQTILGQYNDIVADYDGIHESVPIGVGTKTTKYMTDEPLEFDNEPPDVMTKDVAGPYLGSLWTISARKGDRGKLFFSPPGRPESIAGFIFVSSDDDPLERVIFWNGIYCWTKKKVYAIEGQNPFLAREIHGVPGTNDPNSVIPTPNGIAYRAPDGPRLFNGSTAPLINPQAVFPVFHNEQMDGGNIAVGTIFAAAYHRGEYYLSDSSLMYAVDLATGAWRNCGYAPRAMFAEPEFDNLLGGIGTILYALEVPRTLKDGTAAIAFEVEVPGVVTEDQSAETKIVQRVYFDIDTHGQSLSAILLPTGDHLTSIDIGPLSTANRTMVEVSLVTPSDIAGILIAGSLTDEVELDGVYYDLHLPEPPGQLT